ncbi:Phosphotransferase enzyme protein [Pyrenophora tritici-repentis]|uniref:Phosphotransferase enzyme protein n=2 Tax=Pyrenophora tritici-repentis TaxID=45151 RepID=A0A922N478_9PLEO|nr:Phosphotransferase enzyme protein [Pyrenophora tritici-repentis]KAI1668270.1 Phosphotransferase enzyme protein [Pyrenophora tritici-repentis]KAI1681001.1 Phosphotransferase enzyme protein [Pyrenophora tritici-repentis]
MAFGLRKVAKFGKRICHSIAGSFGHMSSSQDVTTTSFDTACRAASSSQETIMTHSLVDSESTAPTEHSLPLSDCMRKNFKAVCKKFKLDYRHDTVTGTAMIATIFEVTSEDAPEPTMEGVPESIATHVPEPIVQDAPEPTSEDTVEVRDEEGDNEGDEDDEDDDNNWGHRRCDFKITNTIPEAKYVELFRITKLMTDTIQDIRVVGRKHGFYNAATFVEVKDGENVTEYVVRVPGHSTTDQWTENDAYVLEREAQLIEHIRKNTTAPVPHVIAYCSSHDNLLGFPYILMTKLPGQTADTMWDDGSQLSNQAPEFGFDPFYLAADVPSAVMEKKRLRFLRSLARIMLEIQTLSFPHIGMPIFNPDGSLEEVGPSFCVHENYPDTLLKVNARPRTNGYL